MLLGAEKSEGSCKVFTFLRIELDMSQNHSRLPADKLASITQKVQRALHSKRMSLQELQELIGHLDFACDAIALGQAFFGCLCDSMRNLSKPHYHCQLTAGMREDLKVWLQFLGDFNGIFFLEGIIVIRS